MKNVLSSAPAAARCFLLCLLLVMTTALSGCMAALQGGGPHGPVSLETAEQNLEKWRDMGAGGQNALSGQNTWLRSVSSLPSTSAIREAKLIYGDSSRPNDFRSQAAFIMMGRQWTAEESIAALPLISANYAYQDQARRVRWERGLAHEMRYMSGPALNGLYGRAPTGVIAFPWSVILLEKARREAANPIASQAIIGRISAPGIMADNTLISSVMASPAGVTTAEAQTASSLEVRGGGGSAPQYKSGCLVLAVSASGPYAPFASRITKGAEVARRELAATGANIRLEVIDTESADWVSKLTALPPECAVVGGPMKAPSFAAAKAAGQTSQRAFFTFLPKLDGTDEGLAAWRFYTAPDDQILALLRFTGQTLMIKEYGSFYPNDSYGLRMAGAFERIVHAAGGTVKGVSYNASQMSDWTRAAGTLLSPRTVNKTPIPTANFKALFLPDSWKNMDMLTTSLLYHGEDHQILMGTALWEQGLAGRKSIAMTNYELAIFPGAWNPAFNASSAGREGVSDFWSGLGYDFVRFGSALDLRGPVAPSDVNARIASAQNINWAMAPLSWANGKASQSLFLFTPSSSGFKPLNQESFKERYLRVQARFANRIKASGG